MGELRSVGELVAQDTAKPSKVSLDVGAGVVGDEADDVLIEAELAEVACAVDGMETGVADLVGVADVVNEPRSQEVFERAALVGVTEERRPLADGENVPPTVRSLVGE